MSKKIMNKCPLNYECSLMCGEYVDREGDTRCENDEACEHFSLSWSLPYEYDLKEKILIVKNSPARFYWEKETGTHLWNWHSCKIDGMEAGWYCEAANIDSYEGIDYKKLMKREWKEAGWAAAIPNPKFTDNIKSLTISING
jgi:hypothetical protein